MAMFAKVISALAPFQSLSGFLMRCDITDSTLQDILDISFNPYRVF